MRLDVHAYTYVGHMVVGTVLGPHAKTLQRLLGQGSALGSPPPVGPSPTLRVLMSFQ